MRLQLQHVLTGIAVRTGKEQRQPMIDGLTLRIGKRQVMRLARIRRALDQLLDKRPNPSPRHPNNPHSAASGGSGNGNDGVGVTRQHRRRWSS